MVKNVSQFVCANCQFKTSKWQGRCPECGQWNTFEERSVIGSKKSGTTYEAGKVVSLANLENEKAGRISTGINELDAVLGGGVVTGSLLLLGGDPGIGKSTLALQAAVHLEVAGKKVLYISGEESAFQIKTRESRLGIKNDLLVLPETNLESVLATLEAEKPDVAVVDSVQTLYSNEVNGVVGGVSQIVYATNQLMRFAKSSGTSVLIIGHVTKEGVLAGPKTLEHMVDAVLYLEGERFGALRILRCIKNRFGSVGEVGVFEMTDKGMVELTNPSAMFLDSASLDRPGSCVASVVEGNKALLVEVQALVNKSNFGYPKRTTSGFDNNRLQLILAILEKHLKVPLSNYDVFINVVGGFKLDERAADLPMALAVLSSLNDKALPKGVAAFGEIGLAGEIRNVPQAEKRVKEMTKLGYTKYKAVSHVSGLRDW